MESLRVAGWMIAVAMVVAFLMLAQNFLIPLVVAACIFFVLNSLAVLISKVHIGRFRLPVWLCKLVAMVAIVGAMFGSIEIIIGSVNGMMEAAPVYEQNLESMYNEGVTALGLENMPSISQLLGRLDFATLASQIGTTLSSFAGSLFLVIFYVMFMLMEQNTFPRKWRETFRTKDSRRRAGVTMDHITDSVRNYITYKTLINLGTAALNLLIIWLVGMDFPIFWGFLIFLLNWIPTIGTLFSVALPGLFALVQFNSWPPAIMVAVGIVAVQTVMINIIEPRVLGKLLNISGLVVMLSLVLWGMIWGIVGMVLSVPIMVSLIIILSNFPSTRPVAIWLSADGKVDMYE